MRISITLNQLRKMRHLDGEEIRAFANIIKDGGVTAASEVHVDKLRAVGLMSARAGRAWVRVEINGKGVAPFLGHKQKKIHTDHQKVAAMFMKKAKKAHAEVDAFTIKEWKFASTLAKHYDVAELEAMIDHYLVKSNLLKVSFEDFYYQKSRLHRELSVERTINDKSAGEGIPIGDKW